MSNERKKYQSPLISRYTSDEMLYLFSEDYKFMTWRTLWIALAESEHDLGLPVTKAQIDEMKRFQKDVNYKDAEKFEKETRHDVMAHVRAYAKQCPNAAGIIHLGATSAYVGDNTDLIQIREAGRLVASRIAEVIETLGRFARKHANTSALGYTHFQPAQPVTVGKRACLWIQDLLLDLRDLETYLDNLSFLGVKGTTGTQASFLKLFDGNAKKVKKLDEKITKRMGFASSFPVTGQTYPRKIDSRILFILDGIAQSCHKFASDIRLLQHLNEMQEPFASKQIGSSAMAYKRNPMRSERICSLARFVMSLSSSASFTAATQWFERTLDDSANKRLSVAESFLAVDAILLIYRNVADGMQANIPVIKRRLAEEIPFMATENILMEAVKKGGNRQELHEKIRVLSMEARERIMEGKSGDLLANLAADPDFRLTPSEIRKFEDPRQYVGLAPQQVLEFLSLHMKPALRKYQGKQKTAADLKV